MVSASGMSENEKATTFDLLCWPVYADTSRNRTPERQITSATYGGRSFPDYSAIRTHQRASRIHFGDSVTTVPLPSGSPVPSSPKKATSYDDLAKQRDLNETVEPDEHLKLPSSAKEKELVGNNIFGAPPKPPGRPTTPERKRALVQKYDELNGSDIFRKGPPDTPAEKLVCDAKIKELCGSDIFSDGKKICRKLPPGGESVNHLVVVSHLTVNIEDAVVKVRELSGTNPALPDVKASAYLMEHPKKMSDKHTSDTKIKEISGNYDFFCGQDCLDFGKAPLGFPPVGPHLSKRQELVGSDSFPPITPFRHDPIAIPRPSEKHHGDVKLQEMSGNYDLLSYAPGRRDQAGYIKCTPEKSVSIAKRKEMVGNDIFSRA